MAKNGRKSRPMVFSQAIAPTAMAKRNTARMSPWQMEKLRKIHPETVASTKRKSEKWGKNCRKGRKKP